jgi:hypothetical protein
VKYFTACCHCFLVHCYVSPCLAALKCNMKRQNTTQVMTLASASITLWNKICMQKTQTSAGRKIRETPHLFFRVQWQMSWCFYKKSHWAMRSAAHHCTHTFDTLCDEAVLFNTHTPNLCTAVNGLFLLIQNVLCWKQTWIHNARKKIAVCIWTLKN